ncbi:hypothetical protein E2C01_064678 [Portunus trituberculatus]|uniref:K Homology domain-containing protein n=1 Tax=Portunus trituberculatus TaxID=210409 RepID=A0A5B7HL04_PORTR|nr:hypothetical protein [Portunus trituberculatus]
MEEKLREAEQLLSYMRHQVVGPRGETLRRLAQEYPAVRMTVPPHSDTRTASVSIRGPRLEAAVVADCVSARVQAAGQRQHRRQSNKRQHSTRVFIN